MKNKSLISIVMPTYNVADYLEESLKSVVVQSYTEWELIICDDGSTDGTLSILDLWSLKDDRIRIIKNKENQGISIALNNCLAIARGKYIARCDGDDVMVRDRLERQLEFLLENPSIDLVGTSFVSMNRYGAILRKETYFSGSNLLESLVRYVNPVSHIWLAKKEVYDVVGGYRLSSVEDYDFILRCLKLGFKIDNMQDFIGMQIRVREDNTVSKYGLTQRVLFNYARKLAKNPQQSYNINKEKLLRSFGKNSFFSKTHYISDILSSKAAESEFRMFRTMLICISALLSPWKMQYYLRRYMSILMVNVYRWKK